MNIRESILKYVNLLNEEDPIDLEKEEPKAEGPVEKEAPKASYLDTLKKFINGELVAEWQYELAHKAIVGRENLSYLEDEFADHAKEEHEHFEDLADALLERGGKLDLNLVHLVGDALPKTEELTEFSTEYLRNFFERAETNAINEYQKFYDSIEDEDKDLADIINGIISDERQHKYDLEKVK